jgi:O-antigen/teichoic acid export membrane protein
MSLFKAAVFGGLWTAFIGYGFFTINIIINLLLARILAPEDFGVFALALSIVELLFIIGGLGISLACINLHSEEPEVFDTGFTLSAIIAGCIFFLTVLFALALQTHYDNQVVAIILTMSAFKCLIMVTTIPLAVIEVEHRFKTSAIIMGLGRPLGNLGALALAYSGFGVWSLLCREALAMAIMAALSLAASSYRPRFVFNRATAARIIRYSWAIFFQRMTDTVFMRLPVFLLSSLGGSSLGGFYERSLYISTMLNSIMAQIYGKVGFTIFSKAKNAPEKVLSGLEWNFFFITRLSFGVGLLVALFPETILVAVMGEQWRDGAALFRGFSIFIALFPIVEVLKVGLMALGVTVPVTLARVAAILCTVAGVVIGMQTGFWPAVSWSMSAGMALMVIWLIFDGRAYGRRLKVLEPAATPLALSVALALAVFALGLAGGLTELVLTALVWTGLCGLLGFNKVLEFYRLIKAR